jgi:2-polyprenyl-3-methyl-5-hydroxy-6-metoxy-1,4-benzoquinol methylase
MIIIQASSKSYLGSPDKSIMEIGGEMVVQKLVSKLLKEADSDVVIAAPDWDRGGHFDSVTEAIKTNRLRAYYGSADSPLDRLLGATQEMQGHQYVCRIDGLNLFLRTEDVFRMFKKAEAEHLDVVKFPDDFPPAFGCDVYRVEALRKMKELMPEQVFCIHPKFYMFKHLDVFTCAFYTNFRAFDDHYLRLARETMRPAYDFKRLDVEENESKYNVPAANQISFHYKLAQERLGNGKTVLDLACGNGFGSRLLASNTTNKLFGVDLDSEVIDEAVALSQEYSNIQFEAVDVFENKFEDESFDVILAFEILEHVHPARLLAEIRRLLKRGGEVYLSTPQSSLGHIPICYDHVKEYSATELKCMVEKEFLIKEFFGIKQGNIIFHNDVIGNNSFLVAEKSM